MSILLTSVLIVAAIGVIAGVGLAVAAKVMHVPVDVRVEQLLEVLPGANCGACGYVGCADYADAMSKGAPCNLCIPGGAAAAAECAALMGVQAETVANKHAFVCCAGTRADCAQSHEYVGEQSCAASAMLYSGQKACNYGCLGFGDCAAKCPHGAISFDDGLAVIDKAKCIGCGLCVKACPKKLIKFIEIEGKAVNRCANCAPGALARKQCKKACIGCRICEKNCPEKAVSVTNNLAWIDPAKCSGCGLCISKCPAKCLVLR
ncbi:MAG: RnfABCDGE type electron transport complex subunit B [Oscillospiraceae bacterium]|jgi:Na+-translocating ferredoxin:NAD+ oxidoreductase RNF subunit RnfB|nr:RnfABCDGE type electron transport complex subunit B [Oscillospiraceae bacterium]